MKEQTEKPHVIVAIVILFLLFLWELAYGLGLIDPLRFSHPLGVLPVLADFDFLRGFGLMLLQVAFACLIGGSIGVLAGRLILTSSWLTQATLRFLRLGQWLPFFVFWALSIWGFKKGELTDAPFWIVVTVMGIIAAFPTVTLSAIYYFLSARSTLGLKGREARPQVVRAIILQALLICLLWQIWLQPYGWNWFAFPVVESAAEGYAALVILMAFIFLVDLLFGANFNSTAELRGTILARELAGRSWSSFLGAILLAAGCVALWQLFSEPLKGLLLISLPVEVLGAGYRLLISGTAIIHQGGTVWGDMGFSLIKILGGILLAGSAALVVAKCLSSSRTVGNWSFRLLPLTYAAPIVAWLFLFHWRVPVTGPFIIAWHGVAAIACLGFFPFVHVLWGLRDRPLLHRLLLALDEALPFAFLAMLFGEAYAATDGLGFFIVVARAKYSMAEAVAGSLLALALLVGLSSTLRWVVKRLYDSESSAEVLPV